MNNAEDQITEWFRQQSNAEFADFPIAIGDDMAEVRLTANTSTLITTDMLLEGVHFDLQKATLEQVGYKAIVVNLSDCAAMATLPVAAVVAVALPNDFGQQELKQLHAGIILACDKFGCELIGGDINKWKKKEPFAISVAMLSKYAANKPVRRSGAKPGDSICVTGSLGGSGQGKHLEFEPRVKEAIKIAQTVTINSMIDISDGLSIDLSRICRQSKVGAVIDAERIPISDSAQKSKDPLSSALNDGEDFELLFTLAENDCKRLLKLWNQPLTITQIGTINNTGKIQIKNPDGQTKDLQAGGYNHLKD